MRCGLLTSMIKDVCQFVTRLYAAALCKHGYTGRGPAPGGESWDQRNIVLDGSADFFPADLMRPSPNYFVHLFSF